VSRKICAGLSALFFLLPLARAALETAAPETQGIPSRAILEWVDTVERDIDALHSFVLVRHGKTVAEGWWSPYGRDRPHMLYSLSKSFTSTAVGLAVDEGRLKLDDTVASFFPDRLPDPPGENLTRMRVRDLLCMGTGNHDDTLPALRGAPEGDWVSVFLAQPVQHEPGTFFRYNTGATYMLAAILQKATGQSLLDYLTPRLFAPLEIRGATWETCPRGINTGGYGLKVKTRDIAAFGQLYLQNGVWQGKTLLSTSWVAQATSRQISNGDNPGSDWAQGYGFQFWRCRHNAYRGDGAFGQYCVVMPDQDAVLAITGGLGDMQRVLDTVWQHLLPAMAAGPLPADPETRKKLAGKLASLALPPVQGERASPLAADVRGKAFAFDPNEKGLNALSLEQDGEGRVTLLLRNAHGEQRLACGAGVWTEGEIVFEKELTQPLGATNGRQPVAASGAWFSPEVYMAHVYFIETPYRLTLKLHFKDDRLYLDITYNVAFGRKQWQLIGR
jgi:CubicO group peptidase (beta-lactamase class C family)